MNYISNVFSLNMILDRKVQSGSIDFNVVNKEDIPDNVQSMIHYDNVAAILSDELGRDIPVAERGKRVNMKTGDSLYLAMINGGPINKDAKTLPKGRTITYVMITVL